MKRLLLLLMTHMNWCVIKEPPKSPCNEQKDEVRITISSHTQRSPQEEYDRNDYIAHRMLTFLFGESGDSPRLKRLVAQNIKKKNGDPTLKKVVEYIEGDELEDSAEEGEHVIIPAMRSMVWEAVNETLSESQQHSEEVTQLLIIAEQKAKAHQYKFYTALAGLGGVTLTSMVTIMTLLLS